VEEEIKMAKDNFGAVPEDNFGAVADQTAEAAVVDMGFKPELELESALNNEKQQIEQAKLDRVAQAKKEQAFQGFYEQIAKQNKLDPNPDAPANAYDFRSYFDAITAGKAQPPQPAPDKKQYKLPEDFTLPGNPDFYVKTNPQTWTLEQTQKYIKDHPAQSPEQEAQLSAFLDTKKAQVEGLKMRLTDYDKYVQDQNNKQIAAGKEYPHEELLRNPEKMSAFDSFATPYVKGVAGFFTRPFGVEPLGSTFTPEEIKQSEKDHPVASAVGKAIGGITPVAAAITLAPETLLGQLFAFSSTGAIGQYGIEKTQGSLMDQKGRQERIVKTTLKSAAYAPLWFYTKALTLGGPVTSILTRAGARGIGAAGIEKAGGASTQEAVMSGLMTGALSGILELTPFAIDKINSTIKNRNLDDMAAILVKNDEDLRNVMVQNYSTKYGQAPSEEELTKLIRAGLTIEVAKNNISTSQIVLNAAKLRNTFEPKIPEIMSAGERGQVLIPFNEGDIVRVGGTIGKISKIAGDNAIIVSTLGKEFATQLKNLQATGLKPQELPEDQLKKVPENKKDYVRELFKIENPQVVDEFIKNDPDYQKAIERNKQLGEKVFIQSDDPEVWPEYYHKYLKEKIQPKVKPAEGQPEVIIWMGLPGSGKSALAKNLNLMDTHIQIDSDDAKMFIPESVQDPSLAPHVQNESTYLSDEILLNKAIDEKKNIIWPKIGKNENTLRTLFQKFRDNGYKVVLNYNKLSSVESKKRAYKRYLEDKRLVPVDYIDKIGDLTLDKIYDNVKLEADQYAVYDVNQKFGESPKEIEKGVGDAERISRYGEAQGLEGSRRPTGLLRAKNVSEARGEESPEEVTSAPEEIFPPEVYPQTQEKKLTFSAENEAEDLYVKMSPEDQAKFGLEMDDLRKTPEGNLFVAIKQLGGIRPYRKEFLKEELQSIPFYLKRNKGQALDEIISELKTFGWHFESGDELLEAIKEQTAHPIEKADRASLRQIIREAEKNKQLQIDILDRMKKRRKFIQTVKSADKTAPEVKQKIESRYTPITNEETLRQAKEYVDTDYNSAIELVEGPSRTSTFANAVGIVLIDKAQAEGRFSDAIRLVERLAEKNTELGQAVQALAMYERLTPEGILQYAERQVRRAQGNIKQKERLVNYEKLSKNLTSQAEKDKLAEKLGIPHISEVVAGELRRMSEMIHKLPSAEDWPDFLDSPPRFAYQYMLDIQKKLEDVDLPPDIRKAFQVVFDEFKKAGIGPDTAENVPWTTETQDIFKIGMGKISRAKQIETALLLKKIADQIPVGLGKKVAMLQTLAQLLNPKTFIRNILGNIGFQFAENISDTFGTLLDISVSLRTGKRTVYVPNIPVQAKGLAKGMKEGTQEALLGINLKPGQMSKYTLPANGVFDKGVMGALEKTLRISLSATDRAFYQAAFNQSLRAQTLAAGMEEPTEEMIEKAHYMGLYRTFQDDNVISDFFVRLKKLLNLQKDFGLGDIVIKYPKTPANILARGIEYSPFGFIKTVFELGRPLFKQGPFNQEEFVRSASRAFTGSALLVGAGAILATLGIISGKRAKDKDVAATREMVGIREYQLNTSALKRFLASGLDPKMAKLQEDDTLITYDWFLPGSIGLALGANMILNPRENIVDKTLNLGDQILQASETLQQQPLVSGLKVLTSKQNLAEGVSTVMQNIPSSFVPTLLNQIRQLSDNTARNTRDPNYFKEVYNKAIMRIPGASGTLPEKIDTLGRTKEMYQLDSNNPFNVFLNPAFVNKYKPDPVSKMVLDIWESTGETIHFPRVVQGKIKLGSQTREPIELTPGQYTEFQKYVGNKTDVLFTLLSDNKKFLAKSDDDKAKILQGYLTDVNTAAKAEILGYRPRHVSQDVITIIKHIGRDKRQIDKNFEAIPEDNFGAIPEDNFGAVPEGQ
jgi:adenylate kinase family enzyme